MKKRLLKLGVIYYCYALCAGIAFQALLPYVLPNMLAPGAVLTTDSQYFHQIAIEVANRIQELGWSSWSPFPNQYTAFNVALLGAIYALFGINPKFAVPMNALFHAASALMLFLIVYNLLKKSNSGLRAGLVVSLLFLVFPSALNWYGQIHKDSFVIFGIFSLVLSFVLLFDISAESNWRYIAKLIMHCVASMYLIAICRPYYLNLISIFFLIYILIGIVQLARKKYWNESELKIFLYMVFGLVATRYLSVVIPELGAGDAQMGMTYANTAIVEFQGVVQLSWHLVVVQFGLEYLNIDLLPFFEYVFHKMDYISYYAKILAETRQNLILYSLKSESGSLVDGNVLFRSVFDIVIYLPRALIVAVFAPFPSEWLNKISIVRLTSYFEMLIVYISFLGCLGFVKNIDAFKRVFPIFLFSMIFMSIFGITIANVGTLYRVRFSFEFLLVAIGVYGWTFLAPKIWETSKS